MLLKNQFETNPNYHIYNQHSPTLYYSQNYIWVYKKSGDNHSLSIAVFSLQSQIILNKVEFRSRIIQTTKPNNINKQRKHIIHSQQLNLKKSKIDQKHSKKKQKIWKSKTFPFQKSTTAVFKLANIWVIL